MNTRQKQIEEQIRIMIDEIERLRTHLLTSMSTRKQGKQAQQYYIHLKIGMCLSLIDIYRIQFPLSLEILDWFRENYNMYIKFRNYVYGYEV